MAATRQSKKRRTKRASGSRLGRLISALPRPGFGRSGRWAERRRPLLIAGWLGALGAAAAAWTLGVPRLEARVATEAALAAGGPVEVEFAALPAWVRGDLLAMLELTAREAIGADPLARHDLVAARRALLSTAWFDSIEQIRRLGPSHVVVEGTFVQPAAVIRDDEGDHLVDTRGRLLPRSYPRGEAEVPLVISGVHDERPSAPGAQWPGADVTAALRLLRLVESEPWHAQVAFIDAGDFLADGTLEIRTDSGARIVWGSPPGEETALEVSSDGKLAYLDRAYEDFGRIDTGYPGTFHFYERGYFAE